MSSNRVQGARLKAAAGAHAKKQLGALGVKFASGSGNATFKGSQAYAYWELTDGGLVRSFGINYPAMPDNALVSRPEADLIAAYTLHEIGHVAFTDNSITRRLERIKFHLWNGIEDARIEHAVIASGRAAGARSAFKRLMSKFTATAESTGFNPSSINSAPFALALVCRAALGDGNGYAKTLLGRIPEPKRALYEAAAAAMPSLPLDRSGSAAALAVAEAFLAGWLSLEPKALSKPEPVFQPQPPAQPEQAEQSEGEQEQQEQLSGDSESEDAEQPDGPKSFGAEFDAEDTDADTDFDLDGGGAADEDEDEDEDGVSQEAIQQAIEEAMEAEDGASAVADDSVLFDQADDADDESEGQGYGQGEASFDDVAEQFDEEEVISAEPNVDDLFQQITARTKSPIDLPPVQPGRRSMMRNWRTIELSDDANKRNFRKLHKSALPALKAQLFRVLRAPERCGWDGGALGGRFDGKRSARMLAGSEAVFKRRWLAEGIDTVVSVVVDCSGSMKGDALKQSVDLAWTIAEAAESAGAEVEVTGFTTKYSQYNEGGTGLDGKYHDSPANVSRSDSATLIVAKRFQDKCASVAQLFNIMKRCADGGTPDYSAIRNVCEQLSNHRAQRKLVIVITDGCGEVANVKLLTQKCYELYGVDVIGFGIGISPSYFKQAYELGATVGWDLTDLHKTCLKSVADQLAARDIRRAA